MSVEQERHDTILDQGCDLPVATTWQTKTLVCPSKVRRGTSLYYPMRGNERDARQTQTRVSIKEKSTIGLGASDTKRKPISFIKGLNIYNCSF